MDVEGILVAQIDGREPQFLDKFLNFDRLFHNESFLQYEFFDDFCNSFMVVVGGDVVRDFLDFVECVADGYAETRVFDHAGIDLVGRRWR